MKTIILIFLLFTSKLVYSQKEINDSICFFVPNNISINDEEPWRIVISDFCKIQKFNFQLFNRWGSILFEVKSIEEANSFNPFDRQKNSNVTLEPGNYLWRISYTLSDDKKKYSENGLLTIIR
jgi:hypothetical protein